MNQHTQLFAQSDEHINNLLFVGDGSWTSKKKKEKKIGATKLVSFYKMPN